MYKYLLSEKHTRGSFEHRLAGGPCPPKSMMMRTRRNSVGQAGSGSKPSNHIDQHVGGVYIESRLIYLERRRREDMDG